MGNRIPIFRETIGLPGNQYKVKGLLGEGAFGRVVHCTKVGTKEQVAVKILKEKAHGEHELQMLTAIKSLDPDKHNVVRFIECFSYKGYACLVFEKLDRTLSDFVEENGKLDAKKIQTIARQMLVTLDALKQINVIHSDIKPDNVMLVNHRQELLKIKLTDFGVAVLASDSNEGKPMQALLYRSPEVMLGLKVTAAIDMWSFGCLLSFLYTGRHLYAGAKCEYDVMRLIAHLQGQPNQKLLSAAKRSHVFFNHCKDEWKLKPPTECGIKKRDVLEGVPICSLNGLTIYHPKPRTELEYNDTQAFLSLLKLMLHPDYDRRITPSAALQHEFIGKIPKDVKLGKSTSCPNADVPDATAGLTASIMPVIPADDPGEGPLDTQ